jgi:hypothetical protein
VIERLRRLFDLLDPMPQAVVAPTDVAWDRLTAVPDTGIRGANLCFTDGHRVIHVEVGASLSGMVTGVDEVQVWWPGGVIRAPVDAQGLFEVDGVPAGPVRLVVGDAATDWFVR